MLPASRNFIHVSGKTLHVDYDHRISVNNVDGMCQLVKSGLGLATLPYFLAEEEINAGRLIELLPDWQVEPLEVFAVWPPNAPRESLTRRLLDHFSQNVR
jgi:DNA-binding transcriptional LysR family regulator